MKAENVCCKQTYEHYANLYIDCSIMFINASFDNSSSVTMMATSDTACWSIFCGFAIIAYL